MDPRFPPSPDFPLLGSGSSISLPDASLSPVRSPFEETANMLKSSSSRSLPDDKKSRLPPPLSFLGFSLASPSSLLSFDSKLSPRVSVIAGVALCLLAVWVGGGAWQRKCCQCAQVKKDKIVHHRGPTRFIYIYDFGTEFTDDIMGLEPLRYSRTYDTERLITELLLSTNHVRTTDPHEASLFFIPFFSSRYTMFNFQEASLNMAQAVRNTSLLWEQILRRVRGEYPFFNMTGGKDHFGIITMDLGRCSSITYVPPSLYGDMFFISYYGDRLSRSSHAHSKLNLQFVAYSYKRPLADSGTLMEGWSRRDTWRDAAAIPDIQCYMPDQDILIPPRAKLPLAAPEDALRSIKVLFQYHGKFPHGVPLVHHGHDTTAELLKWFSGLNIEGWELTEQEEVDASGDLGRAVFCLCPPGLAQWGVNVVRSILWGCIPVTFFKEVDCPWEDELDYEEFSLNIDPDRIDTLQPTLEALLEAHYRVDRSRGALRGSESHEEGGRAGKRVGMRGNPLSKIEKMQRALSQVQPLFSSTGSFELGTEAMLLKRLQRRAVQLRPHRQHALEMARILEESKNERQKKPR